MDFYNKVDLVNMHESDTKVPYMELDGKRLYFSTQNEMFLNSQCLFIEYTDIIKSPYIILLYMMIQNPESFEAYYEVNRFRGFDVNALSEWYTNRSMQNPFSELLLPELKKDIPLSEIDSFVNNQILAVPDLIKTSPLLNFASVVSQVPIGKDGIVKKVVIWYPFENEVIRDDLYDKLGESISFVTGELENALEEVPSDSTYVFSDITNIEILIDKNKLNQSSVLIPSDYKYNYIEDDLLKIDYQKYLDESLFKLGFFNATEMISR